jgi:hypothetical protein
MQINPNLSFWLGIVLTAIIGLGSGTVSFTGAIPADWIPAVTAWLKIISFFGSAILTALHGYSSGQSGPLTK